MGSNDEFFQRQCTFCRRVFTRYKGIYVHSEWFDCFECYIAWREQQLTPVVYDDKETDSRIPTTTQERTG